MKKWLLGLMLGAILGVFDGMSALVSAADDPRVTSGIVGIVVGSTFKGIIAGVLVGWFAQKVHSLPLGILFGLAIGAGLALPIAYMNSKALGRNYYWHIMLPGSALGIIVGYATQRYGAGRLERQPER
jgi:hypothetical protein